LKCVADSAHSEWGYHLAMKSLQKQAVFLVNSFGGHGLSKL
jgi:hypothetical protein